MQEMGQYSKPDFIRCDEQMCHINPILTDGSAEPAENAQRTKTAHSRQLNQPDFAIPGKQSQFV
jgi:hypothetical protein